MDSVSVTSVTRPDVEATPGTGASAPSPGEERLLVALLRLHLAEGGVGPRLLPALVERFGDLPSALEAGDADLAEVPRLGPARLRALRASSGERALAEIDRAKRQGVRLLGRGLPGYPSALAVLPDAPIVLYVHGELSEDEPRVAIVGSRRASGYARRMARQLAEGAAARGVAIVSGLARGVDAEAHEGALAAGGRTVAVLGCGVDICYPPEHGALYERCRASGAVVSEMPLGAPPLAGHFPRRNRIIAGLSRAVCVVAAEHRSGSLTTASWALEQGREVLAVPHRVGDVGSEGVLALLCDGAHPATSAEQLVIAAGLAPKPAPACESADEASHARGGGGASPRRSGRFGSGPSGRSGSGSESAPRSGTAAPRLSQVQRAVLGALGADPLPLDDVIDSAGLPAASVFGALLDLEGLGFVEMGPGQTFRRTRPTR